LHLIISHGLRSMFVESLACKTGTRIDNVAFAPISKQDSARIAVCQSPALHTITAPSILPPGSELEQSMMEGTASFPYPSHAILM